MQMCEQMKVLRQELSARNIEWQDKSSICPQQVIDMGVSAGFEKHFVDTTIFRTHFHHDGVFYSVIYGFGSYGGVDCLTGQDDGLLECMIDDDDPVGHLTAKDIIDIIEGNYKS